MKKRRYSILPRWLSYTLFATFLLTGILVSSFAYLTASAYWERVTSSPQEIARVEQAATDMIGEFDPVIVTDILSEVESIPAAEATETAVAAAATTIASERVTVLVMGIDRRPGEAFVSRTDSMILLSINTVNNTAAMMSVPRDLYVDIPGYGRNRINTAFVYGAQNGGPAGGAELAMETVSYNLGVPIDHYVLVDFSAFIKSIDTIGGIDVYVPKDLYDSQYPDMNYGYDPLYIPAGTQHFDGTLALKYARTRHADSDFGRAYRQQQVLLSARSKIMSLGFNEMLEKLPQLYQNVSDGVRTDMPLTDLISLAAAAGAVPTESINTGVLDTNYVSSYTTPEGASVLILQNDKAAVLVDELFFD